MDFLLKGVRFAVEPCGANPPLFVLSVRKSGSTMLNNACRRLALHNNRSYVNVPETMFDHNIVVSEWIGDPALADLVLPGNVYGGFRNFPLALADRDVFHASRKVVLVRDPRDALVSEYFSNAFTHPIPDGEGGV